MIFFICIYLCCLAWVIRESFLPRAKGLFHWLALYFVLSVGAIFVFVGATFVYLTIAKATGIEGNLLIGLILYVTMDMAVLLGFKKTIMK